MIRLLTIFLLIALLGNAGAATFGLYTYEINPDYVSVTITDCPAYAIGTIEIPATISGRSVISIGGSAFNSCSNLTSVIIGNSVTSIGYGAFAYCTGLTSINIPDSITSIGGSAFGSCNSLTSIVVAVDNPNYSSIGSLLLNKNGAELITGPGASGDITIPDSVTSIGDFALTDCSSLTSVNIGNSVTSIGRSAFADCTGLTSINIPDSATSIEASAFADCTNLASIRFQSIVAPTIGTNAFDGISIAAMIHYRQGATGYQGSYGHVATLEDYFTYSTAGEVNTAVATAVATATTQGQQDAVAALARYSYYTSATAKAQLIDMRTGSTMLNINGSNAVLQLQIQRSDDLSTWTSTSDDLIEVRLPIQQGKEFFRFAMPQE